jgi:hypothetical protein
MPDPDYAPVTDSGAYEKPALEAPDVAEQPKTDAMTPDPELKSDGKAAAPATSEPKHDEVGDGEATPATASDPGGDFKSTLPAKAEKDYAPGIVESDRFAVAHVPDDIEHTPADRIEDLEETVPGFRYDGDRDEDHTDDERVAGAFRKPGPEARGLGWGRDVKPDNTAQKPTQEQADKADLQRAKFAEKYGDLAEGERVPGTAERAAAAYEKAMNAAKDADK